MCYIHLIRQSQIDSNNISTWQNYYYLNKKLFFLIYIEMFFDIYVIPFKRHVFLNVRKKVLIHCIMWLYMYVTLCIICIQYTCAHAQLLSCVQLFETPWTVVRQVLLSMGFSRHEYWSGLPFLPPGNIPIFSY